MKDPETHVQETGQQAKSEAESLLQSARQEGRKLADTSAELGQARAEQAFEKGKGEAESQVDAVQAAVDDAAQRLDQEDHPFASYASELSSQLSTLSSRIESASLDDLVRDGRRVSRENPGLFMLGAVAVGFAASRFLKASEQREESDYVSRSADDAFDDDIDDYAYARASGTPYRTSQPYRRAPVQPVTPVSLDSTSTSSSTTGAATPATAATASEATGTTPRVNPPVNDRDGETSLSASTTR